MLFRSMNKYSFSFEKYDKKEGIDIDDKIFPKHFLSLIIGKPGSGKTTLLKHIMSKILFKQFDYVFLITPSPNEFTSFFLPKQNIKEEVDWEWIFNNIKNINLNRKNKYTNVLFILDDIVSDVYKLKHSSELRKFVYNRRHLLDNGMISIIMTSQKFNDIPTCIRSTLSLLIMFRLNRIDCKIISEQIAFDKDEFEIKKSITFNDKKEGMFMIYRIYDNKYFKQFEEI